VSFGTRNSEASRLFFLFKEGKCFSCLPCHTLFSQKEMQPFQHFLSCQHSLYLLFWQYLFLFLNAFSWSNLLHHSFPFCYWLHFFGWWFQPCASWQDLHTRVFSCVDQYCCNFSFMWFIANYMSISSAYIICGLAGGCSGGCSVAAQVAAQMAAQVVSQLTAQIKFMYTSSK